MFDDIATDREAAVVCRKLQTKPYVVHLEYISREQALKEQTKALGADPSEFLGVNPFVPSAEIHLRASCANSDSLKWIGKQISSYEHVAEVSYQKDLMESVNRNLRKVALVMVVLAVLLMVVSFSLINNTVRLGIFSRRFSINTMKLVGASWSFIRLFTYESETQAVVTWEVLAITGGAVLLFGLLISTACVYFSVNHYLNMPTRRLYKI